MVLPRDPDSRREGGSTRKTRMKDLSEWVRLRSRFVPIITLKQCRFVAIITLHWSVWQYRPKSTLYHYHTDRRWRHNVAYRTDCLHKLHRCTCSAGCYGYITPKQSSYADRVQPYNKHEYCGKHSKFIKLPVTATCPKNLFLGLTQWGEPLTEPLLQKKWWNACTSAIAVV